MRQAGWSNQSCRHLNKPGSKVDFSWDPIALISSLTFALTYTWLQKVIVLVFDPGINGNETDLEILDGRLQYFLCITYTCFSMCLPELENHPVQNWHHKKKRPELDQFSLNLFLNTTIGRRWWRGEKGSKRVHSVQFQKRELGQESPQGC